jgi:hypothetical protein
MAKLPDIPGKDLVEDTTKKARAIVVGAGSGALAVGGFVVRRVLGGGGDDEGAESGLEVSPSAVATDGGPATTDAGPATTDGAPAVVPTGEGRRTATKRKPAPKPKAAKPKPAKAKAPKPKPAKPTAAKPKPPASKPEPAKPKAAAKPKVDPDEPPATTGTDAPTVPGAEPGDQRGGKDPHHSLNNPVADPDETEYPDPYDKREDPRDPVDPDGAPFGEEPHPQTGSASTSEPPPAADPEGGDRARPPKRENLDD